MTNQAPSRFTRWLLPGLGVKALVIGGGYATGRELAEFFLSRGPWGGLFAILFATLLFSIFCALTLASSMSATGSSSEEREALQDVELRRHA